MRGIATLVGALLLSGVLCRPNEDHVAQTVAGNGQFARNMYSAISGEDGNIIFSPFSIHVCLSMLYQGSTDIIHNDLEKALGVSHTTAALGYKQIIQDIVPPPAGQSEPEQRWQPKGDTVTIEVADKMYLDQKYELKDDFKNVLVDNFLSDVEQVDFTKPDQAVANINHWVEEKTRQKIKDLLSADDVREAALVLINAIYFKGGWLKSFPEYGTKDDTFHLDAENEITVPLMEQTNNFLYKEDADLDARIVELPYFTRDNNQFSMIIVLPNKKDGISELEQKLANKDISDLVASADYKRVNIKLPKFKIEQTIDLEEPFAKLGLESLFVPSQNLSGLIETDYDIVVSKAIHKAFIEVNEKGTEAAAATALVVVITHSAMTPPPPTPKEFHADHPFVFAVVHHPREATYRDVLFYGRVQKPEVA